MTPHEIRPNNSAPPMFSVKQTLTARWVAVLDHRRTDRALKLNNFTTRCIRRGEIHELLIVSDLSDRSKPIDSVCYLGFAEFLNGGVLSCGDELWIRDVRFGLLFGFDHTHEPNHQNLVISSSKMVTGAELGLSLDESLCLSISGVKDACSP